MYSISQRIQKLANSSLSYATWLCCAIAALSLFQLHYDNAYNLPSKIDGISIRSNFKNSRSFGSSNKKPKENTRLTFDLETDLSPLFTWNTKQVFVYLTAEYPDIKNSTKNGNKVTYWDKIITEKSDAKLNLKKQKSKYHVWDVENSFKGREAIVRLEWNIQPYVGALVWGSTTGETVIIFPNAAAK